MGFSVEEGWEIINKFRSPHLWKLDGDNWRRLQELPEIL